MKVFHIIPNEGKFLRQLRLSMASIEDTESRYVLYPKWPGPDPDINSGNGLTLPGTTKEFEEAVVAGCLWAEVVLVHGMTPQAGQALAKMRDEHFKDTSLVWSVWGFDLGLVNPQSVNNNYLPLTWIELAKSRRIGVWKHNRFATRSWKGPREQFGGLIDRAFYHGFGGPLVHDVLARIGVGGKTKPPQWMETVAPRIDLYCALERQPAIESGLPGFRGDYHQLFPYYSLSGMLDHGAATRVPSRNIVVGGRSHASSNHLDALSFLQQRIMPGQLVYLPLGYGDPEYGAMIARYANRKFGDAAQSIFDWMPLEDYADLLSKNGIVFMNQIRGQSLGTEILAMARGAKLYLWSGNTHAKFFRNSGLSFAMIDRPQDIEELDKPLKGEQICENLRLLDDMWSDAALQRRIKAILDHAKDCGTSCRGKPVNGIKRGD